MGNTGLGEKVKNKSENYQNKAEEKKSWKYLRSLLSGWEVTYHIKSFYQLIRHGYVNVEAVTQEDEVSEVLNGSLHNSIVNNLEK